MGAAVVSKDGRIMIQECSVSAMQLRMDMQRKHD
jgi:hypothetical protein